MTLPPKRPPVLPGQRHHANTLLTIALPRTFGAESYSALRLDDLTVPVRVHE